MFPKTVTRVAFLIACLAGLERPAAADVTVVGTGDPAKDPLELNAAINGGPGPSGTDYDGGGTVTLMGTFNLGMSGVTIGRDVTLVGTEGSKIVGGVVAIRVAAPGVTLSNLTVMNAGFVGVLIVGDATGTEPGETITVDNSTIVANCSAVMAQRTGGWPITISNNELVVTGDLGLARYLGLSLINLGIFMGDIGYRREIGGAIVPPEAATDWVRRDDYVDPVNIVGNDIYLNVLAGDVFVADAILVQGWSVSRALAQEPDIGCQDARLGWRYSEPLTEADTGGKNPAEWGDNGPVSIIDNVLTLTSEVDVITGMTGISVGRSSSGTNHALVQGNTIIGSQPGPLWGIAKHPYGYDNRIIGNNLEAFEAPVQIFVAAHDTIVADNVLGPLVETPWPLNSSIPLVSVNWHCDTPMPLPVEDCVLTGNDYGHTGATGWEVGKGNILLVSYEDMYYPTGSTIPWPHGGSEVTGNLVSETDFPEGTGTTVKQIRVLRRTSPAMVTGNQIVGVPVDIYHLDGTEP